MAGIGGSCLIRVGGVLEGRQVTDDEKRSSGGDVWRLIGCAGRGPVASIKVGVESYCCSCTGERWGLDVHLNVAAELLSLAHWALK